MTVVDRFKLKVTAKRTVNLNSIKHSRKYVRVPRKSSGAKSHSAVGSDDCLFKTHNANALQK